MADVVVNDASLLDIGNAIREKNGEQTKYKPSEMGAAIRAISGGGQPVEDTKIFKFKKYDGTVIAEYTYEEIATLSELPPLPAEDEYTIPTGWGITVEDCHYMGTQKFYQDNGYIAYPIYDSKGRPSNGAICYVFCTLTPEDNKAGFAIKKIKDYKGAANFTVDWGDGTSNTYEADDSQYYTYMNTDLHNYTISGDSQSFVIKITSNSNKLYLGDSKNSEYNMFGYGDWKYSATATPFELNSNYGSFFSSQVTGIISDGFTVGGGTFFKNTYYDNMKYALFCKNSKLINTLRNYSVNPNYYTPFIFSGDLDYIAQNCYTLTDYGVAQTYLTKYDQPNKLWYSCQNSQYGVSWKLNKFKIDNLHPAIKRFDSPFQKEMYFPENIEQVEISRFTYMPYNTAPIEETYYKFPKNLKDAGYINSPIINGVLDFSSCLAVPSLLGTNVPIRYTKTKILVPKALYNEWIAATNWSALADYIEGV